MRENYIFLAEYNKTINLNIYSSCEKLTDEERKKNKNAFFGSIHNTLSHLVLTDKVWLNRFASQREFKELNAEVLSIPENIELNSILFYKFEELKEHRFKMDSAIYNWILNMPEDFPQSIITYKNMKGIERKHKAWYALTHFFNHQTHHRGQITTLLNQSGIDIGVTDIISLVKLS